MAVICSSLLSSPERKFFSVFSHSHHFRHLRFSLSLTLLGLFRSFVCISIFGRPYSIYIISITGVKSSTFIITLPPVTAARRQRSFGHHVIDYASLHTSLRHCAWMNASVCVWASAARCTSVHLFPFSYKFFSVVGYGRLNEFSPLYTCHHCRTAIAIDSGGGSGRSSIRI